MQRIYSALIEIAAASVFIIPIFSIYGKYIVHNVKRTLIYMVLGFYLVAVLALVGFPSILYMRLGFSINLIPFAGIAADFKNACLNVLLFVPLGIFLPVLWDKYRNLKSIMLMALCMTVGIELSQMLTFRATDINDVITNMTGALAGYFIAKGITKNFTKYIEANTKYQEWYLICGAVAFIMFLLQPFVSNLLWEMIL